ncbi:conserved hypothetical protein [Pediculus humanus corporis]|uniref:Calcium channel flower n=1 Tax=Pediculus humanus subsp. corporis TaxID=121224 RepID=E0VVH2_PEDHC|nr:uncharacterized protein Phum_PHUM463260 [Pediculus humanus corporis]EEB17378.1 conserved hypothetical protein [Pediculus humanus corporis]
MDKVGSLLARPNKDLVEKDDVPWWLKLAGRGVGTIGGGLAIFFGVWNCVGILLAKSDCLLAGIWQMLAGFFVIIVEAPCCCIFIDFVQTFSDWVDKRPFWNRGLFYISIAIPPIFLCFSFSSLIGSGLIFVTGVIYGFMALGKKGSQEDMAAMAAPHQGFTSPTGGQPDHSITLMEDPDVASAGEMRSNAVNDSNLSVFQPNTNVNMKSSLTQNAQDIARDIP